MDRRGAGAEVTARWPSIINLATRLPQRAS
jgi:hypothetical protein